MAAKFEPVLTIADLDAMPDDGNRYELIEGELFASCAPSLVHQSIVRNLIILFGNYLISNPIGKVWPGPGVIFSDFSGVIPDVVYVSNERLELIGTGDRFAGAPDLIVEILSPGTENQRRDRHSKRQLYRKYGVKEYWIVDHQTSRIDVYRTARMKLAASLSRHDYLTTSLLPGFSCSVKDVFR
jgi:Uma2 family endonuclease